MRKLIVCLLLLGAAHRSMGQFDYGFSFSKAGTAGLQFLKVAVTARDAALAEATTSLTNDPSAVFVNPGGLAFVERPQAVLSHNEWLAGSRQDAAVVALPVGSFVVALSANRFAIQEFEETTVFQPAGTGRSVRAGDIAIGAAVARRFTDRLTIGLQLKYVQESLDNDAFGNMLMDVGAIYSTGFRNLRLAFALQHFGPDMKILEQRFRTPLLFRVSAADDLLLVDEHRLTTAVDLIHPTDDKEWVNWGLEYEFMKVLSLRAGYRFNVDRGKLAFGAGVRPPGLGPIEVALDYAYVRFDPVFGATHRITLGIAF